MKCGLKITCWNGSKAETVMSMVQSIPDNGQENDAVNLHPDFTYQTFGGFGGALTEAAALTYAQMPAPLQKELLEAYYGKEGLGYTLARMSVDSCDFGLGNYSAMTRDGDVWGSGFSLARDEKAILPLYQDASETLGRPLEGMLSPWSPPAFMKTNGGKNHGGKLKPEYYEKWAQYLCRYLKEYRERGVDVKRLSVQNEPAATQTWDSCLYDAQEEKRFLRDFLHPALRRHDLEDVELYIWDHNKERALERTLAVLDKDTAPLVAGVALHWYSGDHFDALRMIRERYPHLKLLFSEACIEYSRQEAGEHLANARRYAHNLIGDLNEGVQFFHDWNILLDETGGPNHAGNFCDAPIHYDREKRTLEKRLSYEYLGHFTRAIVPGSVRIGSSKFSPDVEATAFRRPDGTIAAVLLNRAARGLNLWLRVQGELIPLQLPGDSIATAILE